MHQKYSGNRCFKGMLLTCPSSDLTTWAPSPANREATVIRSPPPLIFKLILCQSENYFSLQISAAKYLLIAYRFIGLDSIITWRNQKRLLQTTNNHKVRCPCQIRANNNWFCRQQYFVSHVFFHYMTSICLKE